MAFAALTIDLNARLAKFEQDMARANKSLDGLSTRANAAAAGLKTAFGALGGTLAVGALANFVKSSIDAQDAIAKLSQRTGIAAETLAGLEHAAQLSGVEVEQLGKGVRTFSVLVDEAARGQKSYQDKLTSLGLNYKELRDLSPEEQFYKLADAVSRLGKEDRAAKVAGALGDRMSVLVPLLSGGAGEMRKLVEEGQRLNPVTAESARRAEEFNDNLDRLKKQAGLAGIELTTSLLPSLSDTAQAMVDLSREGNGLLAVLRGLAGIGKLPFDFLIGDPFKLPSTAGDRIKELQKELGGLQRDLKSAQPGGGKSSVFLRSIFGTPEEISRQITVVKNQIDSLEKFGDQVFKPKPSSAASGDSDATAQIECIAKGGIWDGKKCVIKPRGGATSDPLASLLGSTDIGKLAEFDKQVALLNARFDGGRKNAELYTQAMTKLVETTFAGNFTEYNRQLAEQEETQRAVAEHTENTNRILREQAAEWDEAGRALTEQYKTPLEQLERRLEYIDELFRRGKISVETYGRAYADAFDNTGKSARDADDNVDQFGKKFAENTQDIFADFFTNFDKGTDGMLKSFGEMLKSMIAQAAAADLARVLFGDKIKGGEGGGVLGSVFDIFGGLFGGARALGGPVISGRTYLVGERGPELFTPGGSGSITPNNALRGMSSGHSITVIVQGGQSAPDVRRAAGQGAREALMAFNGAQRYA